ncbi:NAD-dependent epimerase/dehydratase family protein [Lederbergia wuyishanensis]|uniref:Nucleoside-diphosphate-sugar epimerase n=1 Tax=Lederbergia wuyishanensis TaxID=1347903 RepID=A0ABU0D7Q0_9BACI|nr:NAD-dependent epimerase/dehydratase family protein [Lederbergia wuyishanensis]MCJ8009087.1 epimerase [Lederbergia wuyishanensis]MDQ0344424.1 nucleoside-diphosphate-sugar epimerase [Lederbergia wuyishanensis]
MKTIAELEDFMSKPSTELIEEFAKLDGDIMILGVGGKMGPTLAKLAKRAINAAGVEKKVIGVSRFSSGTLKQVLEDYGIETIALDLLEEGAMESLPTVKNIIYMAGNKFGTYGNEHFTWAMNVYLPGKVAERFKDSRIVVFSSGNVYPLTKVGSTNCSEETPAGPIGEYAQSCLGRERVFTYFSHKNQTPILIYRLNYAIDLRYGVLLEIAKQVYEGSRIDLTTGSVNVIWQGDANEYALRSLFHCEAPPKILNITGPETISVRWLAEEFGKHFNKTAHFINEEQPTALLNNASKAHKLFGYPKVTLNEMIELVANWVKADGVTLNKPTHFQEREGVF